MNYENITKACLLVFDILRHDDDLASKKTIELIDNAETDDEIRNGLREAVVRLDIIRPDIANEIREKTKGFAF